MHSILENGDAQLTGKCFTLSHLSLIHTGEILGDFGQLLSVGTFDTAQ